MNLFSLTVARNEAPFIGLTLRAALSWNDAAVVLLHACTDDTKTIVEEISAEHPGRVYILEEHGSVTWSEMEHRHKTLVHARSLGATHCSIVDADEVLTGDLLGSINSEIRTIDEGFFLSIPLRNMHGSLYRYRSDGSVWGRCGTLLTFADRADLCWRTRDGYDHHHRKPFGSEMARKLVTSGGVMHLQFVTRRRLIAKHAWYKIIERLKYPHKSVAEIEQIYNQAPNEQGVETSPASDDWWRPYQGIMHHLRLDEPPWQEEECRRLVQEHGEDKFKGLTLFGVV